MERYEGWKITTGFLTGNLEPSGGGVDMDALVERYADDLLKAVEAAYPGAHVTVRWQNAVGCVPFDCETHVYTPDGMDPDDDIDLFRQVERMEEHIDNIQGDVYEALPWDELGL